MSRARLVAGQNGGRRPAGSLHTGQGQRAGGCDQLLEASHPDGGDALGS
jgi:hypothetical protein